jgi:hypothetical protein
MCTHMVRAGGGAGLLRACGDGPIDLRRELSVDGGGAAGQLQGGPWIHAGLAGGAGPSPLPLPRVCCSRVSCCHAPSRPSQESRQAGRKTDCPRSGRVPACFCLYCIRRAVSLPNAGRDDSGGAALLPLLRYGIPSASNRRCAHTPHKPSRPFPSKPRREMAKDTLHA